MTVTSPPPSASFGAQGGRVGRAMMVGLARLWSSCLPTGEVPMWRADPLDPSGGRILAPNILASTVVHDALACFDPNDPDGEPRCLLALAPTLRPGAVRCAQTIRLRIRRWLAWHESASGGWSFYGRGSGLPSDAPSTACAAVSLLAGAGPRRWTTAWQQWVAAHRGPAGSFHTVLFVDPDDAARYGSAGYGSIDGAGRPQLGHDRVFNAHILRFAYVYAMERACREGLERWLAAELEQPDQLGSVHHPSRACLFHALARALRVGFPPASRAALVDPLATQILARRRADGGFGGPLSTALAVLALLDIDRGELLGPETLATLCASVLDRECAEPYFVGELGSEPFNLALIAAALARLSVYFPQEALA